MSLGVSAQIIWTLEQESRHDLAMDYVRSALVATSSEEFDPELIREGVAYDLLHEVGHYLQAHASEQLDTNVATAVSLATYSLALNDWDGAEAMLESAREQVSPSEPCDANLFALLAKVHQYRGTESEGSLVLEQGIGMFPSDLSLWRLEAQMRLGRGDWSEGWKRWSKIAMLSHPSSELGFRSWSGGAVDSGILLCAEGDAAEQILLSRWLQALKSSVDRERTFLYCSRDLARWFARFGLQVVTSRLEIEWLRSHRPSLEKVPLSSLPHFLGLPSLEERSLPVEVVAADGLTSRTLKVGLYWRGAKKRSGAKPISLLNQLLPILGIAGCTFSSLHRGSRVSHTIIESLGSHCHDFDDVATAIASLDVIIAVDSAVALYAASIGKKTVVLLSGEDAWWWDRRVRPDLFADNVVCLSIADKRWVKMLTELLSHDVRARGTEFALHRGASVSSPHLGAKTADIPIVSAQTRYGTMVFPKGDAWIGRSLELYGDYSLVETRTLCDLVQPGQSVIEVGANVGAISVALAERLGVEGRLDVFEPQPALHRLLEENLRSYRWATAYPMAFSDQEALLTFCTTKENDGVHNFGGCALEPLGASPQSNMETIKATLLDRWIGERSVDLIKIDVEGMELQVLRGAIATIRRHRPLLYIEDDRLEKRRPLRDYLWSLGYKLFLHRPPFYAQENWNAYKVNVFGDVHSVNLLCIPRERLDLLEQVWSWEGARLAIESIPAFDS